MRPRGNIFQVQTIRRQRPDRLAIERNLTARRAPVHSRIRAIVDDYDPLHALGLNRARHLGEGVGQRIR